MAFFRFFRIHGGICSFAAIKLSVVDDDAESITWSNELAPLEVVYGEAVGLGIRDALQWHMAAGAQSSSFRVVDFTELLVDTRPDAARCAATGAAWSALGHETGQLRFEFEGHWVVKFAP